MRETHVTLPELALVAGTRVALGAGLGLLLADRLTVEQRRAIGWTLLLFGAISTVPLAFDILGKFSPSAAPALPELMENEPWSDVSERAVEWGLSERT
jgi:hypothetical protein